jgi:hypothetical protein
LPIRHRTAVILLLNGAFGVGKTAVARSLVGRLPGALLFDPEVIGIPLQRASHLLGKELDDFQDLALWRRLTLSGMRAARLIARNLIVPMAFSNPAYLMAIRRGAARFDPEVHHFCLVASEQVVHHRLRNRGADPARNRWEFRRASECCAVHQDPAFAIHVDAADRSPAVLAEEILGHLRQ